MASPPRTREREEERQRRLNARTLVIASAASASAAAVTSQLWIAGTWIAAAITPVLVALVSELLHRPSERIARALTSDQPALVLDDAAERPAEATHPDPDAPPPQWTGAGPVRVYRQPPQTPVRPRIALGVVFATAAIALAVAVVVITVPELIAGQSLGKGDNATTFGGGKAREQELDAGHRRDHHPNGHRDDPRARAHEHGHDHHRAAHRHRRPRPPRRRPPPHLRGTSLPGPRPDLSRSGPPRRSAAHAAAPARRHPAGAAGCRSRRPRGAPPATRAARRWPSGAAPSPAPPGRA